MNPSGPGALSCGDMVIARRISYSEKGASRDERSTRGKSSMSHLEVHSSRRQRFHGVVEVVLDDLLLVLMR